MQDQLDPEENFIPSIFNYCDRWCERCEFTARCRTFAMEQEYKLEESEDPMGDALETVANALADAKEMLLEKAEEMGIDLYEAMNDPEVEESLQRAKETVESEEAVELAKQYALETRHILEKPEGWAGDADEDPMILEMLEILRYYLFSIAVKVHSSFHAVLDIDGYEDPEQLSDTQSDANGNAKITLILIERSVLAWSYLMNPSNAEIIRPVIARLETIKHLLETKFPNAREFIRPGFDELEAVM